VELLRGEGPVLRIGHRGAKALAPENTLESFRAAVEAGVDLVEFDALALGDGRLVVAHSPADVGPGAPTLDEAFVFFGGAADVGLHVDLKSPGSERELVDAIRRHGLLERTLVTCPLAGPLVALRALEPALRLGLGYPYDRFELSRRRALAPVTLAAVGAMRVALPYRIVGLLERAGASVASLHHLLVTRAAVLRCHRAGAAVLAWTVNDSRAIRALVRAGVDGIVTDDPRLLADTLDT
jgi:glycerophosphoryl diester phosphodiesterase